MTTTNNTSSSTKPILVFVHGYFGGSPQWQAQRDYFAKYFEVMTPDLPGFGLKATQTAPESITGFAQAILAELDQQNITTFYLLGHSMGGMIAQEITRLAPQRITKLVLYGTGPLGVMPGRYETIETSRQRLQAEGVLATARRISAKWFVDEQDSPVYADCAAIAEMAGLQAALAGLTAMENWSGAEALPNIPCPTLVLWGDQDRSYQWPMPERLWREIPGAALSVVAGCSHAVHLEKPALFNAMVEDFLLGSSGSHS